MRRSETEDAGAFSPASFLPFPKCIGYKAGLPETRRQKSTSLSISPLAKESPTQGMLETSGNNQRAGMKWKVEEKSCGTNKFVLL